MINLTEIKISDLLEENVLTVGTRLFLDGFNNMDYECHIIDGGKIELIVNSSITYWDFPSGPAKSLTKISVNGWIRWYLLEKGEKIFLTELRSKYYNKKMECKANHVKS